MKPIPPAQKEYTAKNGKCENYNLIVELKLPKGIATKCVLNLAVIMGFPLIPKLDFTEKLKKIPGKLSKRALIFLVKVATSKFFDGRANGIMIKMKKEKPGQLESSHSNPHVLTVDIWTNHLVIDYGHH
jgi:hypothetical protein